MDLLDLLDLLPEGYLVELMVVLDSVNSARKEKAVMAEDSKQATRDEKAAVRKAKIWRRKVSKRASRAVRMGREMPDGLLEIGKANTVPALMGQLQEMAKLFEANLAKMPGKGADELLARGKALAELLGSTDAVQEIKRQKDLPDSVKRFYEQKGLLYTGLKIINDAGQELYADNPGAASAYNLSILSILHRRAGKRSGGGGSSGQG